MGNKNNERISLRRRTSHLVKRAKLKHQKDEELASILDCTHLGQINKDFTYMGAGVYSILMILLVASIIQIFLQIPII